MEIRNGTHTLTYRLDGPEDAPWLVLSNSLGTSLDLWEDELAALRAYFHVLRYEMRGHGGTAAPRGPYTLDDLVGDVVALLDGLGIQKTHFLGTSLGGLVGLGLALRAPERLDHLVVAASRPAFPSPESWTARAQRVRSEGMGPQVDPALGRWFTPGFREKNPSLLEEVAAGLKATDPEGYAGCCEALAQADLEANLKRISAPTLILAGAADPVAGPDAAARLASLIPKASLIVFEGAAHLIHLEKPRAFREAVLTHLADPPGERGENTRRAVMGGAHVDRQRQLAASGGFRAPIDDFITEAAWGKVWSRPGLARPTRRLLALSLLAALGRWAEFDIHARAALDAQVPTEALQEALLQLAVYAGVPAANTAFHRVQAILDERGGGR